MEKALEDFYLKAEEPNKSCFLALRKILNNLDPEINETRKYGMPCFCYKKKHFCYLWTDKKTQEPYLLLVEGDQLDHPQLESGNRKRMKIFRVNPNEDLPIETIRLILDQALCIYKA